MGHSHSKLPTNHSIAPLPPHFKNWRDASPELLALCFEYTLDGLSTGKERIQNAVNLSHVSRHWRDATLAHSPLWTSIILHAQHPSTQELAGLPLTLAGANSLNVILNARSVSNDAEYSTSVKACLTESARWRSLTIRGPDVQREAPYLAGILPDNPFPRLEALHLAGNIHQELHLPLSTIHQLGPLTVLRSLRISGVYLRWDIDDASSSNFPNLVSLELSENTISVQQTSVTLQKILSQLPKLEKLALGSYVPSPSPTNAGTSGNPIHADSLRHLQVPLADASTASMFKDLSAPHLERLSLRPCSFEGWKGFKAFLAESGHSFPHLHTLEIGTMRTKGRALFAPTDVASAEDAGAAALFIRPKYLPQFIDASDRPAVGTSSTIPTGLYTATPMVRKLVLDDVQEAVPLRGVATALEEKLLCWPHLEELVMSGTDSHQLCDHVLKTFVKARQKAKAPLRTVWIQDDWVADIDPKWMRQFAEKVEVKTFTRTAGAPLGDADW